MTRGMLSSIAVLWNGVLLIIATKSTVELTTAVSRPLIPLDIMSSIAVFLPDRDLCAFSQLDNLHHRLLRDGMQIRKQQRKSREEMKAIRLQIRGHSSWGAIFGDKLIGNASPEEAIDHLIHQLDGCTTLLCLESIGIAYKTFFPDGVPSGKPLFRKIREYQKRWLIGGHPVYNPPHRYEKIRYEFSDAQMSLFEEYIALFVELRAADYRFQESHSKTLIMFAWPKVMEIIGARIGYPNMKFYNLCDLHDDDDAFDVMHGSILVKWAEVINIEDTIKRFKAFRERVDEMRGSNSS